MTENKTASTAQIDLAIQVIDRKQVAHHLGVSTRTVGRWITLGILPPPAFEVTSKSYWFVHELREWRENFRYDTPGQSETK